MTLTEIKDWVTVAQVAVTAGLALLLLFLRQAFASRPQVDQIQAEMGEIKARLTVIEHEVEAIPSAEEIRAIRETLAEVKAMTSANGHQLGTIHTYLLGRGR